MKLTYNDPNRTKDRQEVVPLSEDEMQNLVLHLNINYSDMPDMQSILQRLIWDYENKCHYFSVKGGWGQTGDIEVNYEIVKE